MSDMEHEAVVTGLGFAKSTVYHTRECTQVESAKRTWPTSVADAEARGLSECQWCAGEVEPTRTGGTSDAYRIAIAHAAQSEEGRR